MSEIGDGDQRFAEFLVKQGLASQEHVQECLAILHKLRTTGVAPLPKLGELLLRKGYITPTAYERAVKLGASPTSTGSAPPDLPEDVCQALRNDENDLGRFVKVSLLGSGGMGEVWRAWQKDLGRYVAIKFIRSQDEEDLRRFVREAQVVAKLQHPNIVPVYEFGMHRGQPYMAMQLIQGTMIDRANLSMRQMLAAIRDAALALEHAHQQGIVHRDVKPSNLMVAEGRVYVMDFGLARPMQVESSISHSGTILGTPAYMSPEQARGEAKAVDRRSDVYSLGATLYALLTGRPPHSGRDPLKVLQQVAEEDPIPPRKLKRDIPWEVETIVLKAMENEPGRRYQTAGELAGDLQRYLQGEPIRAQRASLRYRLGKKVFKHRAAVIAGGSALLMVVGFGGYLGMAELNRRAQFAAAVREGQAEEAQGHWEKAMKAYERAWALRPEAWIEARREQMQRKVVEQQVVFQRRKEVQEAELLYERLARRLGELRLLTYRKGYHLTEQELKEYEGLIEVCEQQMKKTGESAAGWWVAGRAKHVLGDWSGAEDRYRAGLRVQADHGMCRLYLARLLIEQALVYRFTRGMVAPHEAEKRAKESLRLVEPPTEALPEVERDLIRGYELVLRRQDVQKYCEEMLNKWKGQAFREEFYLIRGLGTGETLETDATRAIEERPSFYEAYFWRGVQRELHGDRTGAIEDFSRAVEINPRYMLAYNERGVTRLESGDVEGAIKDYTRALEIDPRYAQAYNNRGNAYQIGGDLERSMQDYDKALEIDPSFAEAYNNRGVARYKLRDWKGAIEDYTRALRFAPNYSAPYNNRGVARRSTGDVRGAIEDYSKAIEINPRYADAYDNRGSALVELAERETAQMRQYLKAAEKDLTRALEAAPPDWAKRAVVEEKLERVRQKLERLDKDF